MNDQERKIISDIFARLESAAAQPRDAEAERLIAEKVRAQPYAPYAMAQSLYVQEEAMKSLNQQLEQLKAENEQLRQAGQGSSGGFLSSLFGGGQRPAAPGAFARGGQQPGYGGQPQYAPQQGGPWGGQPQAPQGGPWAGQGGGFQQPQAAGGGFLRGALTTAAGVAGGMVVGNALMSAFSGHGHSTLGSLSDTAMTSLGGGTGFSGDTGLSNAGFDQGGFDQGGFGSGDASFQDASFDPGGDIADDDSSWT